MPRPPTSAPSTSRSEQGIARQLTCGIQFEYFLRRYWYFQIRQHNMIRQSFFRPALTAADGARLTLEALTSELLCCCDTLQSNGIRCMISNRNRGTIDANSWI